jgi:hypothetical protein
MCVQTWPISSILPKHLSHKAVSPLMETKGHFAMKFDDFGVSKAPSVFLTDINHELPHYLL